jgi:hypothetical protein
VAVRGGKAVACDGFVSVVVQTGDDTAAGALDVTKLSAAKGVEFWPKGDGSLTARQGEAFTRHDGKDEVPNVQALFPKNLDVDYHPAVVIDHVQLIDALDAFSKSGEHPFVHLYLPKDASAKKPILVFGKTDTEHEQHLPAWSLVVPYTVEEETS